MLVAQRALLRFGDGFDLESVTVLNVRRVVIGPSGMRMLVAEEQIPSVVRSGFGNAVDVSASSMEECKAGAGAVGSGQRASEAPPTGASASHSRTTRPVAASSINAQLGTRKHFSPRRTTGRPEVPPEFAS